MGGYYRLKDAGFRLASGAHILSKEEFEPVAAATALVDDARAVAAGIVEEARATFESEKRRGYEEGLARARLEAAERLLRENDLLDRKLAEIEDGLTDIVMAGVRRLVQGFDDREKAAIVVRAALRQMRREKKAELRVAPEQYDSMRKSVADIVADFPEIESVDVVEDPALSGAQIIVETSIGRMEGDIGRNIEDLERIIMRRPARPVDAAGPDSGGEAAS